MRFVPPLALLMAASLALAATVADPLHAAEPNKSPPGHLGHAGRPAAGSAPKPKPAKTDYSKRADVQAFIAEMAQKHGFVEAELAFLFSRARFYPTIVELITPPTNPRVRSWQAYRTRFLDSARIEGGVALWARYEKELARAEKEFGVPPEIIVAIMGVETVYGKNTGNWRVIDALTTLSFDYPKRAEFFRSELENYLLFAREHDTDVFSVRGSYAGAIGIPQFMPGSWRRYAIDFDGNGKINLRESFVDSIGSIGNFLKGHGWNAGGAIAFPARIDGTAWQAMLNKDILPHTRIGDLAKNGVTSETLVHQRFSDDTLCSLVDLVTPDAPTEYWVGLQNFMSSRATTARVFMR